MEARNEDNNEDLDALYRDYVEGETSMEDENERAVESYSEEDLERKREEALEEYEDTMVKALGLDEGPNFEDEEDVNEWFEELDEDELEELRKYRLEQMPDSNGCGLTSYDEGPNEREEGDVRPAQYVHPNGGGAGRLCPESSGYDFYSDCYHDNIDSEGEAHVQEYCEEQCFGWEVECPGDWRWNFFEDCLTSGYDAEECSDRCTYGDEDDDGGWIDDNVPSFTIDADEYEECMEEKIVEIGATSAACIAGGVGGFAVATLAVSAGLTSVPDPTISKATAGAMGAAQVVYFANIVAGCVGGSTINHLTDALDVMVCGVGALEWE